MTNTIAVVRHPVADFDAWKLAYDGFAPIQAEHGVRAHQVLRSIENPNDVIVTHAFDSSDAARILHNARAEASNERGRHRRRRCRDLLLRRGGERRARRRLVRSSRTALLHERGPAHL